MCLTGSIQDSTVRYADRLFNVGLTGSQISLYAQTPLIRFVVDLL